MPLSKVARSKNRKGSLKDIIGAENALTEGKNSYVLSQKAKSISGGAHSRIKKSDNRYEAPRPTKPLHSPPDPRFKMPGVLANNKAGDRIKPNKNKGKRICFRNKSEVYNVESYKIYNADLSKESKAKRRREAMNGVCALL